MPKIVQIGSSRSNIFPFSLSLFFSFFSSPFSLKSPNQYICSWLKLDFPLNIFCVLGGAHRHDFKKISNFFSAINLILSDWAAGANCPISRTHHHYRRLHHLLLVRISLQWPWCRHKTQPRAKRMEPSNSDQPIQKTEDYIRNHSFFFGPTLSFLLTSFSFILHQPNKVLHRHLHS